MNAKDLVMIGGIALVGLVLVRGDDSEIIQQATGGGSGGSGGGGGGGTSGILAGGVPDIDTYGAGDPFEDATTTGTTPVGTTATMDEFESIVGEIKGGRETPTRVSGGHVV